jgi:hypothetical protein
MKENHEKTEKTPGLAVNKAAEIRKAAKRMVAQGRAPSPKKIVLALEEAGIKVTSPQVSTALADTEFAYRRNTPKWESPRPVLPDPLECFRQTSRQNLEDAEKFARKIGSLEGAIASLVALGQLKREPEEREHYCGGA